MQEKHVRHNHLVSHEDIQLAKLTHEVVTKARDTQEATSQIISNALPELSKSSLPFAPSMASMEKMIRRHRYKKEDRRAEPDSFYELELQDGDKTTWDGDSFLIFDSKEEGVDEDGRRLLMWATDEGIKHLSRASIYLEH